MFHVPLRHTYYSVRNVYILYGCLMLEFLLLFEANTYSVVESNLHLIFLYSLFLFFYTNPLAPLSRIIFPVVDRYYTILNLAKEKTIDFSLDAFFLRNKFHLPCNFLWKLIFGRFAFIPSTWILGC